MNEELEQLAKRFYATIHAAKSFNIDGNNEALQIALDKAEQLGSEIIKLGGTISTISVNNITFVKVPDGTPGSESVPQVSYLNQSGEKISLSHDFPFSGPLTSLITDEILQQLRDQSI